MSVSTFYVRMITTLELLVRRYQSGASANWQVIFPTLPEGPRSSSTVIIFHGRSVLRWCLRATKRQQTANVLEKSPLLAP